MGAEQFHVWRIVIRDDDGVVFHSDVPLQAPEEILGKMCGIPLAERLADSFPQLENDGLRDQGQTHSTVADIEVQRSRLLPAQRLIEFEEFFHVPALGVVSAEVREFGAIGGADKGFEVVIFGPFPRALDEPKL